MVELSQMKRINDNKNNVFRRILFFIFKKFAGEIIMV